MLQPQQVSASAQYFMILAIWLVISLKLHSYTTARIHVFSPDNLVSQVVFHAY